MKAIIYINLHKIGSKTKTQESCKAKTKCIIKQTKKTQENELNKVMEEFNTCDFHKYQM
jgi:hypothetical protein